MGTRGSPRLWTAMGAAVALLLLLPASAASVTIGANLNRPANVGYDCGVVPASDGNGNRTFFQSGANTCTYMPTGSFASPGEGTAAPGGPVIATQVRVKTGPVTGPMQVIVLRQTGSDTSGVTCCENVAQSRVFTPGRNGVTRINTRLPMRSDAQPEFGLTTTDYLALSVLAPGVPIPAHDVGNGNAGSFSNPLASGFFPHVRPGPRLSEYGIIGVQVLLNAEVTRICGPGRARARTEVASGCTHALQAGVGSRRGSRVRLPLACNIALRCAGRVLLQSRKDGRAFDAAKGKKRATWAKGKVGIAPGGEGKAKLKLTKAGKRKLRGRGKAKVWVNIRLQSDTGTARSTQRTKIKR